MPLQAKKITVIIATTTCNRLHRTKWAPWNFGPLPLLTCELQQRSSSLSPKAPRLRERPGGILSPLPAIFVPTDLGRPNPIPWNNIETEIESPTPRSGLAAYKMSSRSPWRWRASGAASWGGGTRARRGKYQLAMLVQSNNLKHSIYIQWWFDWMLF